jgi:hypothetical protein
VLLDQGRYRWLAWAGLAVSTSAFAVAMVLVWRDWEAEGGEGLWKTLAVLASFAAAISQTAMTTSRRSPGDTPAVRLLWGASVGLAALAAAMISVAAIQEIDSDGFYRVLGAVVVADVFLVVAQSIARRMTGGGAVSVHALRLTLDRPAGTRPEGFRVTGDGAVVEADVAGADFAAAVATAIRALERGGARVERVERRA